MFNWAKQQLAHVAGTQEPEYGPEAIQPVTEQAKTTPFTTLTRSNQKWLTPDSSFVECQTFYIHSNAGPIGYVQVIYSNVAIKTTCQFNTQIFFLDDKPALWCSDPLENWSLDKDRVSFRADKCSLELNAEGDSYTIKSTTNLRAIVNLTVTRTGPGLMMGSNGTTYYGTDPQRPWGSMYHSFWPRCEVKGSILTQKGEIKMDGTGLYVHALQGMKPHHCAARWNFVNFHSPTLSALMMEFTTPPSYAKTVVNVGAITDATKNPNEVVVAGATNKAEHTAAQMDKDVEWPEPTAVKYTWTGKTPDGKNVTAVMDGELGKRLDRVDVMGELPGFVKQLASQASGTRPYIYQYAAKMPLSVKVEGEEERMEEGLMFAEATFIS